MASNLASSSPTQEKYDVFLSFRGEDTRNGFTSHLNAVLCQKKIKTFIDDELRRGDEISLSLLKAIEGSKISVVIFSKDYASSRWCLEELVKIMDCRKMHSQIVIPVFYHVNPSDVRNQTGTYGDAFAKHEVRYRQREEMFQRWRSTLTDAANISGFHSNVERPESKLVEKIVEDILKRLKNMSSSYNKNLVGMAMKIQKIKSSLYFAQKEGCKVGIWGMGGIGKTTLANAVFNEISSQFEGSYFIQNVREESEKRGLIQLQEKILSTILGDEHHNIRHASTIERLRRKKVLLVFDDLTHLNQINELIGDLENLGSGSKIIITTRDKQVLVSCRVDDAAIYEVKGLYSAESFHLFSQHAFKQNHHINEEYMALSDRVISYSKGVPLALKVLGCFLLDRGKHEWESTLEKLKNCPHQDIQTVLKISYDGLDDEEKNLFLDVACFFNGWDEHLVRKLFSSIGLRVLVDKALITISWGTIRVHDLLQEMGMEIVRQESLNKPGQRSRLWHDNDVYGVLKKNKGTDKIRGLCFNISTMREILLNPHAFSEMDYLRFLIVKYRGNNSNVHGFEGLEFDFTELRCLYWDSYHSTSLPLKFYPQNLVVLKMRKNNLEQLWSGIKDLANIKHIDLSYSRYLLKVPNLSEAQNLECLILEGCTSLFEITPPTRNLNKLVNLNLRNCKSLSNLPIGIQSKSLRDVILSGCSSLNIAPWISCNMERLCLDGTTIKALSSSIESPSRLVQLHLEGCSELESLPSSVCNLNSLQQLNLSGLSNLKMVLGIPYNLIELYLDGTAIKELSSSIENASSLVRLSLEDCSSLESLPYGICKLKSLKYFYISGCVNLMMIPQIPCNLIELYLDGTAIKELSSSIENASSLVRLSLKDCSSLESLPHGICKLKSLKSLYISGCLNLMMVPQIPCNLIELYLDGTAIKELSSSIENASSLVRLSLKDCSSLESLSDGICRLKSLKYLYISGCLKLDRLPEDIGNLESLEVLEADGITLREVPSSMGRLKNLHDLSFVGCKGQELVCSLSPIFPGLPFLRRLNLNHCRITELPNNLGDLSSLIDLKLDGSNFESIPTSIINLSSLSQLSIRFCNRLQSLPKLPCNMQGVVATGCKLLKVLSGSKNLSDRYYHRRLGFLPGNLHWSFINCFNIDWNAVRVILNVNLLKMEVEEGFFSLSDIAHMLRVEKGRLDRGSMVFPGNEIPEWFDIQSNGPRIELPHGSFNNKFLGYVFCAIIRIQDYVSSALDSLTVCCQFLQKFQKGRDSTDIISFNFGHIKSNHVFVGYYVEPSNFHEFNGNTEAIINFYSSDLLIKKCGVHLLFRQEFEEVKCSIIDEEEAHSKRLKSSNFFKGESSSSYGGFLGAPSPPFSGESSSRSHPFTPLDSDEFPQVSVASPTIFISDSEEDSDGDFVKSQPFTPLDLDEFPQDSVGSPIIIISDSDEDNDG